LNYSIRYHPFGTEMSTRSFFSPSYRYGFNGMEKDDEVKGQGNSYNTEFRQLDTRLGRWLTIDPKFDKYPDVTPYEFAGNTVIIFTDPNGDELIGSTRKSARRIMRNMKHETFDKEQFKDFRKLLKRGLFNKSFKKIDQAEFLNATSGLSDDERALAEGYYTMINDNNKHFINVVKRGEKINLKNKQIDPSLRGALSGAATGADADAQWGGGANVSSQSLNQSVSVVVKNSKASVGDFQNWGTSPGYISRSSSLGELIAHEAIGHGLGGLSNSPTAGHADAIQMTNLFLRVVYFKSGNFRDGTTHGPGTPLNKSQAEAIPSYVNATNQLFNFLKTLNFINSF
jgi:RHS repeat-associated protein